MIGDSITITIGGSGGTAKVLQKVNEANYASEYFLREASASYSLSVKHTVPKGRDGSVESHLFRLDVIHYNTDNLVVRKESAWVVLETRQGIQDSASLQDLGQALTFVMDVTLIDKLLARQS